MSSLIQLCMNFSLLSRSPSRFEALQILLPHCFLVYAVIVEQVPRINAGIVSIGECQLDSVVTHGFDRLNFDIFFAGLQRFLARPVAAHLGRRRLHAQQLVRQAEAAAVGKPDFHHPRPLVELYLGRKMSGTHGLA